MVNYHRQRGFVLVVSLLFCLLTMLLTVGAFQHAWMQMKSLRYFCDHAQAFEQAQSQLIQWQQQSPSKTDFIAMANVHGVVVKLQVKRGYWRVADPV